jgi:membrane associated rhomboid family serine protease
MIPIRDTIPTHHAPIATRLLIWSNLIVFLFEMVLSEAQLERLIYLFGVVPIRFTNPDLAAYWGFPESYAITLLTSAFLHGGFAHVVMNLWMLWIFGNNVEDRMGSFRFALFYLICGVLSMVCHVFTNWNSQVPAIGASGAIAGVLGAYFMLFPRSVILTFIPLFLFIPIPIPAYFFLLFWFIGQFFNGAVALVSPGDGAGIAWWAHIGGFLAGMAFYRLFLSEKRMEFARRREAVLHGRAGY